ncbi:hypothetical protein WJX84_006010 [Apatococcus fuscideae]|uniref:GB1/RHD3-type G domain-containing protein n=1 Tax=Apatococcus fuscideae TaxID=2026836 RepID=A0AAW1TJZ1_9CHLO
MWSAPVERTRADGSKYHLVLLDTEGIDAWDQTGQYSTQIFSLAVLLSSLFVYNQMGGIDEAAIDHLSLVTEMTKHIRIKADSADSPEDAELARFTPSFLWLLRDFYLTLEEDGRKLTPREYLEQALKAVEGTGRSVQQKNQIRTSIKSLFPKRDCFSLVRPMEDELQLAHLETVATSSLRPQFQKGMEHLTDLIFTKAQPKELGNQIITGPMLAALTKAYVDAINHGAVPTISTAWQGVAEAECRRAGDAAEEAYHKAFRRETSADEASLDAEHQRCLNVAMQAFSAVAIGDESIRKANENRARDRLMNDFKQFKDQRVAQAALECEKQLNAANTQLMQAASSGLEELLSREAQEWAQYRDSSVAAGSEKWMRYLKYVHGPFHQMLKTAWAGSQQKSKSDTDSLQHQLASASSRAAHAETRASQAEADRDRLRETEAKLRREQEAAGARASQLEEQVRREGAGSQRMQTELDSLRSQKGEADRALAQARQDHQAQARDLQAKAQQQGRGVEQAQQQNADLTRRLQQAEQQSSQLQRQLKAEQDGRAADAVSASSSSQAALRDAQAASRTAQQQLQVEKDSAARQHQAAQQEIAMLRSQVAAGEGTSSELRHAQGEATRLKGELDRLRAQAQEHHDRLQADLDRAQAELTDARSLAQQHYDAGMAANAGSEPMDEGQANGHGPAGSSQDPTARAKKMTIIEITAWLTEHGKEEVAYNLANKKAKKAEYVNAFVSAHS